MDTFQFVETIIFFTLYTIGFFRFIRINQAVGKEIFPLNNNKSKQGFGSGIRYFTKKEKTIKASLYLLGSVLSIVGFFIVIKSEYVSILPIIIFPVVCLTYYFHQFVIGENGVIYRDKFWRWHDISSVEFELINRCHKYSDRIQMGEKCYTFYVVNHKGKRIIQPIIVTEDERTSIENIMKDHSIPSKEQLERIN